MSTTATTPEAGKDEFDISKFFAERNAREAAARTGKEAPKADGKPIEAKPTDEPARSSKPSGDTRKLFKTLRENGELRARLDMLEKQVNAGEEKKAPAADPNAEPKRADFASDQEYADARTDWKAKQTTEAALKDREHTEAQQKEAERISKAFESQMKAAADPEKGGFPDWGDLLKSSKAANVDIYAASPEIFGAFLSSEYAKEVMYEWLKKPETLTFILETAKTDKAAALRQFHRLEGRVAREVEAKPADKPEKPKPEEKKAAPEEKPKPRPTASARVNAGEAVPESPAPGTKAWRDMRNAGIKSRGW